MTTFLSHCIPIIPISALLTVVTCCIPQTFQALSCDSITVTIFLRVYIAIAFTRSTRLPRHKWISIVPVSTPVAEIKNCIKNHRIIEQSRLGGTFKDYLVQLFMERAPRCDYLAPWPVVSWMQSCQILSHPRGYFLLDFYLMSLSQAKTKWGKCY